MLNSRYSIYNMCGIAGIVGIESKEVIKSMCDVIRHRGPDDCGYYIDKNISLGHRRLSIIDLSSAGRQPMSNAGKSIWLVFNGEIYNYLSIGRNLKTCHLPWIPWGICILPICMIRLLRCLPLLMMIILTQSNIIIQN